MHMKGCGPWDRPPLQPFRDGIAEDFNRNHQMDQFLALRRSS